MSVDLPLLLAAAPLLAALVFYLAWLARRARLRAIAAWAPALRARDNPRDRYGPWLLGAAALLAATGGAGPRWGRTEIAVETRALNLAIGIDISRSMLAEDVAPSRLRRATGEARRLLQDARGDRLALLAFAGRSYILTPLTLDDGAVGLQLDALDPEIASEGGTDLASVILQGRSLLEAAPEGGARVMVLFTDGETHDSADAAVEAARSLRSSNVTLILVAEGDTVPARIPVRDERGQVTGWKTDRDGLVVRTVRRDDVLRQVADAAAGVLIGSEVADQEGAVWGIVSGLERRAAEERRREDRVPRGWIFALAALAAVAFQTIPRRSGALVGLLLTAGAGLMQAQRPAPGQRLLSRGDTLAAALAFLRGGVLRGRTARCSTRERRRCSPARRRRPASCSSARDGASTPSSASAPCTTWASASCSKRGATPRGREALEDEAARHLREALLIQPSSPEAKWNLELASRRNPPPPSGGGGQSPPPPQATPERPQPRPSGGSLSQNEAEQILNSVERTERAVRAELSRRRRYAQSSAGKDW